MAVSAVLRLVQVPAGNLADHLKLDSRLDNQQADMVMVMTESGLCKDRVDSMLLLSQIGSFNRLLSGEGDIAREVREWLEEDKELIS